MCKVSMSHGCKVQPQILCFKVIQLLASFRTLAKSSSKSTNPCTNSGHEKGRQSWPLSIMALSMHIRDQLQENGRVSQSFERGLMRSSSNKDTRKKWVGKESKAKAHTGNREAETGILWGRKNMCRQPVASSYSAWSREHLWGIFSKGCGAAARPQRQSSSRREQRSLLAVATMMMDSNDDAHAVTTAVPSSPLPPPQQLKIYHVILDLDGTLIDTGRYSVFLLFLQSRKRRKRTQPPDLFFS